MKKIIKRLLIASVVLLGINFILPTRIQNPVEGCGRESYNQKRNGVPRKLFFSLGCNDEAGKESLQRKRQLFWG